MWKYIKNHSVTKRGDFWEAFAIFSFNGVISAKALPLFSTEPTTEQVTLVAQEFAVQLNMGAAYAPTFTVSKYAFRQRFTLAERMLIDGVESNPASTPEHRAVVRTIMKDFESVSGDIDMKDVSTASGLTYLESIGLLANGRAAEILATE